MRGALLGVLSAIGSMAIYPRRDRVHVRWVADTTPAERRQRREARRNRKRNSWRSR